MSNGLKYKEIRIGGGPPIQKGFLTVLHFRQGAPLSPSHMLQSLAFQVNCRYYSSSLQDLATLAKLSWYMQWHRQWSSV